jgi:HEAT repeat protein
VETDSSRRNPALHWLGDHGPEAASREEVVSRVIPLLAEIHYRSAAEQALARWATNDDVPALIELATAASDRNDWMTQRSVISVLTPLADDRAVETYIAFLRTPYGRTTSRKALEALGARACAHVLPLMNHQDSSLQRTAREILAKCDTDGSATVAQCVEDLYSSESYRQRAAAEWLAESAVPVDEQRSQVVEALAAPVLVAETRSTALSALARWADAESVPKLLELAQAAHEFRDITVEHGIVKLLVDLADDRALPAIANYFGTGRDVSGMEEAFRAFGDESIPYLVPYINSPDSRLQRSARKLLLQMEAKPKVWIGQSVLDLKSEEGDRVEEAAEWLSQAAPLPAEETTAGVDDRMTVASALIAAIENDEARNAAAEAVKVWATADNLQQLIDMVESDDRSVRHDVIEALAALKDPRGAEAIVKTFTDSGDRYHARRHLSAMGPAAEHAVLPYMKHPDYAIAREAIEVIKQVGTTKSISALRELAAAGDVPVKIAAEDALQEVRRARRRPVPIPRVPDVDDDQEPADAANVTEEAPKTRTWTDASGENTVQAAFLEFADGRVRLKLPNGRVATLKLDQLSEADQQYVRQQVQNQTE